jgi:PAS domain S-box-containing protein
MVENEKIYGFDFKTFFRIIDNMYDEVYITDNNYKLLYVNKACARHYGATQDEMIGKTSFDFAREEWWSPSFLTPMYKDKQVYGAKQTLANGMEVLTIAAPIFDDKDNIEFVIMNVRDDIQEIALYNDRLESDSSIDNYNSKSYVFKSNSMKKIYSLATKISKVDATCIITGETGVGKTHLANHMHFSSPRKDKPLISVNCASLPSELIESELFGYSKGAFTGANQSGKKGLVCLADGGTLLLDEISELPLSAQAKILHVVQEKEFIPVGGTTPIKVDVRIIAATNKSLKNLVKLGFFREDLFYRLNVVELYIPPLRKRKEDIPHLVSHFIKEISAKYSMKRSMSDGALDILINHYWRGNIRELKHVIERLVLTSDTVIIGRNQLPMSMFGIEDQAVQDDEDDDNMSFDEKTSSYEGYLIRKAYEECKTSRNVAEQLKISQTRANKLIRKYVNNQET